MKRLTKTLKARAMHSLRLGIEFFNRPSNAGRTEAVLYFLHHASEMLLKAAIYEKRGTVHAPGERETHKFVKCVGIAKSVLCLLDEDMARTLRNLSGQRDAATHYVIELSEPSLYIHAQSAVTLFAEVLERAFGEKLAAHLPNRVLPISSLPPRDLNLVLDEEFSQIRALLRPGCRRTAEAHARLRPLAITESNVDENGQQPTDDEIRRVAQRIKRGDEWRSIFPGVATLRLESTGGGLTYSLRIVKNNTDAIATYRSGPDNDAATLATQYKNMLGWYPFIQKSLLEKLGQPQTQVRALIWHLGIKDNPDYYREFPHHSQCIRGYSHEALARLDREFQALSEDQLEAVRQSYLESRRCRRSPTS
jgi:hypothetical protein